MRRRDNTPTRPLGAFSTGILPKLVVLCGNCHFFVDALDDQCPGCGENVCRVCGCSDTTASEGVWFWADRDHRLCSRCAR